MGDITISEERYKELVLIEERYKKEQANHAKYMEAFRRWDEVALPRMQKLQEAQREFERRKAEQAFYCSGSPHMVGVDGASDRVRAEEQRREQLQHQMEHG